jgi:copper chaperone CopZ
MRLPVWIVPVLVVLAALGGVASASLFDAPSVTRQFETIDSPRNPARVTFTVRGLRCVRTAEALADQFRDEPGVQGFEAFASRGQAEITYDASVTDAEALRQAAEAPVFDAASGEYWCGVFRVVEVDGVPTAPPEEGEVR